MQSTLRMLVWCTAVAAPVAGCASTPETDSAMAPPAATVPEYQLTKEELALDCKKLTGRMQVRILQVRDYSSKNQASALARAAQSATGQVAGGSTQGASPDEQYLKDRAQLEAYNKQLAAKNCKTFDLAEELKPKAVTETPTPKDKGKQAKTQKAPPPDTKPEGAAAAGSADAPPADAAAAGQTP